jgi:hypothetical protein
VALLVFGCASTPLGGNDASGSRIALPPATASQNGYMTATNQGYLDYWSGRWEAVQERFLLSKVAQLTGFEYIKIGVIPAGVTAFPVGDARIEGGALTSDATTFFTSSVFMTPKTGKWGYCVRAPIVIPSAGHTGMFGIVNATGSHSIMLGGETTTSTTNYVLRVINGTTNPRSTSNIAVDGAPHDLCVTDDSTLIKAYVDGVDSTAAIPSSSVASDEGMALDMANQATGDIKPMKVLYSFIQP